MNSEEKTIMCKSCGGAIGPSEKAIVVEGGLLCFQCEQHLSDDKLMKQNIEYEKISVKINNHEIIWGALLLVMGVGCAIYGYITYTEKSRAAWTNSGYMSDKESVDFLKRLEEHGYSGMDKYIQSAQKGAAKRNAKIMVAVMACPACLTLGIYLLLRGLSLKSQTEKASNDSATESTSESPSFPQ